MREPGKVMLTMMYRSYKGSIASQGRLLGFLSCSQGYGLELVRGYGMEQLRFWV